MLPTPSEFGVEDVVITTVLWIKLIVEAIGAGVIVIGIGTAGAQFLRSYARPAERNFNAIRLTLARFLALALEFQLGADILSTAVAPSWEQIGKLGAIAVIRTALNYFLMREMRDEDLTPDQSPGT